MKNNEKLIHENVKAARDFYMAQKYSEAIEKYKFVLNEINDNSVDKIIVKIELGWSYYQNQNFVEAINELEDALKFEGINAQQKFDCLRIIGFCYSLIGKIETAINKLKESLKVEISDELKKFAYLETGKLLFARGQLVDAEYYLTTADDFFNVETEPEYKLTLHYYLGFSAFFQKNFPAASTHFNQIIKLSRDEKTRASGFFGLAHLHYNKKEYPALIDMCEKILQLDDTFFDKETLGYFLSFAYLKLKKWEEFEAFFAELKLNYPNGRYASEYPQFEAALEKKVT